MSSTKILRISLSMCLVFLAAAAANAQTFRVQCPTNTTTHPDGTGIKCQQLSGGDGFATMADGTQMYLFAFGPLSGLEDIRSGRPGTGTPATFNLRGDLPAIDDPGYTAFNGAVGLICDPDGPSYGDPACDPDAGPFNGHVDARAIMQVGIMNGNMPAPLMAIDEDDEFFLTLTNVGQIMRPDLFEQHTVHFHGYPNASAFFDGVPDASVAVNIGGSFTYYYLAPDAGTYFWHCHITPPEHLQMGMVGQLYVRPRQNRVAAGDSLRDALAAYEGPANVTLLTSPSSTAAQKAAEYDRLRKACNGDILCSSPTPPPNWATRAPSGNYAYNDGDGSTYYDVEYPLQIHGFDPNFHFVGMTFNPEGFTDMKDKYFLLNGRGYPDTVGGAVDEFSNVVPGAMYTQSTDGVEHPSQPITAMINIPLGGKALLRISDLDVSEYQTLASLGIPMHVVGVNARLLRDLDGQDTTYVTNSITMAGGESTDVILDASDQAKYPAGSTFTLYTPNLDHLSNDAENFGGLMTEVHICPATVNPATHACDPV